MIVKFNSKNDVQPEGIFHLPEVHWLTNPNDSLNVHVDPSWSCCQKAPGGQKLSTQELKI